MALARTFKKTSQSVDRLTPMQFEVTQRGGTEPRFRNEFWDNHAPGLYVDIVSGEPLFISTDKFDSKSGWPSSKWALWSTTARWPNSSLNGC